MLRRKIYGITVSKNYSDFLEILIRNNSSTFDTWFIVTQEDDEDTIKILKKYNKKNIEIVYYPLVPCKFKKGHAKSILVGNELEISYDPDEDTTSKDIIFDKGGGLRVAQKLLYQKFKIQKNDIIVVIDSDVVFPCNLKNNLLKIPMKSDVIYGVSRVDFFKETDFLHKKNKKRYYRENVLDGYFQMYLSDSTKLFKRTIHCGWVDLEFASQFNQTKMINDIEISHLGRPGINWKGRRQECFLFDTKNIEYIKKIANDSGVSYSSHYSKKQLINSIEKRFDVFSLNAVKDKPSFPNFVVCGFPRCGTNYFVSKTEKHPCINYAKDISGGCLNYCSSPLFEKSSWKQNHKYYMSNFLRCGNCWGDYGPNYLGSQWKITIDRMKDLYIDKKWDWMPDVKFIILLRNPIERLLSQYAHYMKNMPNSANWNWLKPGLSLRENILEELSQVGMVSSNWLIGETQIKGRLLLDGYYATALKYFINTIKPDDKNILILNYEKLYQGEQTEQNKFFKFINVESEYVFPKNNLVERRLEIDEDLYYILKDFYTEINQELFELTGVYDELRV